MFVVAFCNWPFSYFFLYLARVTRRPHLIAGQCNYKSSRIASTTTSAIGYVMNNAQRTVILIAHRMQMSAERRCLPLSPERAAEHFERTQKFINVSACLQMRIACLTFLVPPLYGAVARDSIRAVLPLRTLLRKASVTKRVTKFLLIVRCPFLKSSRM